MTSPTEQWRSERRAAARLHHPDRGGDPAALQAALEEVDRRHGRRPSGAPSAPVSVRRTRRGRVRARLARLRSAAARRRPGGPRHIDL